METSCVARRRWDGAPCWWSQSLPQSWTYCSSIRHALWLICCQACIDLQNMLHVKTDQCTHCNTVCVRVCLLLASLVSGVSVKLMGTTAGNDRSCLAYIIVWLGPCRTACFQLVASSSGSSGLVAACDSVVLYSIYIYISATGNQQWQAVFRLLCTLVFIVTTFALLNAASDSTLLQLD